MNRISARPRALLAAAAITTAVVLVALPASAHVTVSSTDATQGGFGTLTFKSPTESDTASTTSITVTLPADAPFAFAAAQSKPGWKVTTTMRSFDEPVKVGDFTLEEAVATVTWTSKKGIDPGQFDTFALSAGPLPTADQLTFAVDQTYSDGKVVSWDDVATEGEEAEHPAPTLTLAAAVSDDEASSDVLARSLGGAGLLAGLGALFVAVRENRRRAR